MHSGVFKAIVCFMLGLHYVPGSHGSYGSQKRSSPWCFSHFCLCVQVLLSLATFSHGLTRSAVTEARRRATICHGWFYVSSRPVTFCWDLSRFVTLRTSSATSIKFCQGNVGDKWCLSPKFARGIKRRSTKLLQSLYYAPLIKNIITCNGNKEANFVFI